LSYFFDAPALFPNILFDLTQTQEGLRLFHYICMMRSDVRSHLTLPFELFRTVAFQGRMTCLYLRLNESDLGREIIELMQQANSKLTNENLLVLREQFGFNFLSASEAARVTEIKRDVLTFNMNQLLSEPAAQRLLFFTSGAHGEVSLFAFLCTQKSNLIGIP